MDDAIAVLSAQGATSSIPPTSRRIVTTDPARSPAAWRTCSGRRRCEGQGRGLLGRLQVRDEARLQRLAGSLGDRAPVKTLSALRDWNRAHQPAGTLKYGQVQLDISDEMDVDADRARYEARPGQGPRAVARAAGSTRSCSRTSSTRCSSREAAAPPSPPSPAIRRSSSRSAPCRTHRFRRCRTASTPGRRPSA